MDYHPSKHVTPYPQSSKSTNHWRCRRKTWSSCKVRQYFDLGTDKMKYLSELKVALQKVNWTFCHNIMKNHHRVTSKGIGKPPHHYHRRSHSRQKWFSLLTWLFGRGVYINVRNIRKIKQNLQILQNRMTCKKKTNFRTRYFVSLMSNCWYLIALWLKHGGY